MEAPLFEVNFARPRMITLGVVMTGCMTATGYKWELRHHTVPAATLVGAAGYAVAYLLLSLCGDRRRRRERKGVMEWTAEAGDVWPLVGRMLAFLVLAFFIGINLGAISF
jgi:hypothetical protein